MPLSKKIARDAEYWGKERDGRKKRWNFPVPTNIYQSQPTLEYQEDRSVPNTYKSRWGIPTNGTVIVPSAAILLSQTIVRTRYFDFGRGIVVTHIINAPRGYVFGCDALGMLFATQ